MEQTKLEQNKQEKPVSVMASSAVTGFFGGVFWSAVGLLAYLFHFTEIRPNTVLEPWALGDWKSGWLGTVIALIVMGLFGMGAAFLYYFTLKKHQTIWVGILYGFALFILVFYIFNPLFPSLNPVAELKRDTIVTTICLYVLFGVFVGYSISYDYYEKLQQEKREEEGGK